MTLVFNISKIVPDNTFQEYAQQFYDCLFLLFIVDVMSLKLLQLPKLSFFFSRKNKIIIRLFVIYKR